MSKTFDQSMISPHVVEAELAAQRVRRLASALMVDGGDLRESVDDLKLALEATNLTLAERPAP